jgi:hypothetical protein
VIDPQRNLIDHRQRSKSLGQATQFNGRQSNPSPHSMARTLPEYARAVVGLLFIAGSI